MQKRLLIVGSSGYSGQYITRSLASSFEVIGTYSTHCPPDTLLPRDRCYKVDLLSPESVETCFRKVDPDVIVNCAAISDIRKNEENPEIASKINIPMTWIQLLEQEISSSGRNILFVHMSTDQVFDGLHAPYTEDSPVSPVHAYGRSKVAAEQAIRRALPDHQVILRPSVIYGPPPVHCPGAHGSFLQWIEGELRKGQPVKCFSDEFRCFLYVQDLARVIRAVIHAHYAGELKFNQRLLHVGGPEGLSRSAFARKVAAALQLPDSLVVESRQLDTVTAYPRPPNLSMDCSRIRSVLNLELTPVDVALSEIYQKRCC